MEKTVAIWIWIPNPVNVYRWTFSHNVTWSEYERMAKQNAGEGSLWKAALASL